MAGPVFRTVGARSTSAGAATVSPAKPTVDGQNGLLLCVVTSKNNATHSCATAGWVQVGSQVNSGASFTMSVWRAAEGAAAPTITWTGSVACSAQIAYYSDPDNVVSTTLGTPSTATGSTSTHTSGTISSTRDNTLAVYIDVAAANTALATPSGWTEDADAGSATDAGRTVFGRKSIASSGTSSGVISVTGAAAAWVLFVVEVLGEVPASNALQVPKTEVGAWVEQGEGSNFSKIEIGAWLDNPSEANYSKAEVGAWLDPAPAIRRRNFMSFAV